MVTPSPAPPTPQEQQQLFEEKLNDKLSDVLIAMSWCVALLCRERFWPLSA